MIECLAIVILTMGKINLDHACIINAHIILLLTINACTCALCVFTMGAPCTIILHVNATGFHHVCDPCNNFYICLLSVCLSV